MSHKFTSVASLLPEVRLPKSFGSASNGLKEVEGAVNSPLFASIAQATAKIMDAIDGAGSFASDFPSLDAPAMGREPFTPKASTSSTVSLQLRTDHGGMYDPYLQMEQDLIRDGATPGAARRKARAAMAADLGKNAPSKEAVRQGFKRARDRKRAAASNGA